MSNKATVKAPEWSQFCEIQAQVKALTNRLNKLEKKVFPELDELFSQCAKNSADIQTLLASIANATVVTPEMKAQVKAATAAMKTQDDAIEALKTNPPASMKKGK